MYVVYLKSKALNHNSCNTQYIPNIALEQLKDCSTGSWTALNELEQWQTMALHQGLIWSYCKGHVIGS